MTSATAPSIPTADARPPGDTRVRDGWEAVGPLQAWVPWTGRAVRLRDGAQAAVFRLGDDEVVAIGNRDPFTEANVLARGLVGDEDGTVKVASPLLKQRFDLRTGQCLDDPTVAVPTYPVRVVDGQVHVRSRMHPPMSGPTTQNRNTEDPS